MGPDALCWLGHSGVRLDLGGTRVLTDPWLRSHVGPLRRHGPAPAPADWAGPDVVLISHLHHDHLDLPSLRRLRREGGGVPVVVPAGAAPLFGAWPDVRELRPGERTEVGALRIMATPARHVGDRLGSRLRADPVGYLIESPARSVWFAGDTGVVPEHAQLRGRVGLALLPVGGWGLTLGDGHLDPHQAAELAGLVAPQRAVPIHWGTLFLPGLWHLDHRRSRDPGERFRRHAESLAPDTLVTVAPPASTLTLP